MAKETLKTLEKNIIIKVTSHFDKKLNALVGKLSGNFDKLGKSVGKVEKSTQGLQKASFALGKAYKVLKISMISLPVVALMKQFSELGASVLETAVATGQGTKIAAQMADVYRDLRSEVGLSTISFKEMSKTIGQFAGMGIAQQIMASSPEIQKGLVQMQDVFTKALGSRDAGKQMTMELVTAFKDNIPLLQEILSDVAEGGSLESIRDKLRDVADVDLFTLNKSMGAFETLIEKQKGNIDPTAAAMQQLKESLNYARTAWEEISKTVITTFGPAISDAIKWITDFVQDATEGIAFFWKNWNQVWDHVAARILKIGSWFGIDEMLGEDWSNAVDAVEQMTFQEFKAAEEAKRLAENAGKTEPPFKKTLTTAEELRMALEKMPVYIKGASDAAGALSSNMELVRIVGNSLAGELEGRISRSLQAASKVLNDHINPAMELWKKRTAEIEAEFRAGTISQEKYNQLAAKQNEILKQIEGDRASNIKNIVKSLEDGLLPLENQRIIAEKQRSLAQEQLNISKALYGGASLAVEQQMRVVRAMEQEKNLLQDQLEQYVAQAEQIKIGALKGVDLQQVQERVLDLQTKLTAKTAEQLSLVKQLRDGYLDAVQAASFGAGRFSKIIVDQTKATAIALDAAMAAKSFLLGTTGKRGVGGPGSAQYSATGSLGTMTATATGKPINNLNRATEMLNVRLDEASRKQHEVAMNFANSTVVSMDSMREFGKVVNQQARALGNLIPRGEAKETLAGEAARTGRAGPGGARSRVSGGTGSQDVGSKLQQAGMLLTEAGEELSDTGPPTSARPAGPVESSGSK